MQMLNKLKLSNKMKKSQLLLIGFLFILIGFVVLFSNYLVKLKDQVYSDMRILMMDNSFEEDIQVIQKVELESIPENAVEPINNASSNTSTNTSTNTSYVVDYSKYLGVLEIPKIRLKRGFYNVGSRYNNIQYNVTMVEGSTLPDVENGNLILMAHSGNAYISYFAYLYKLGIGDEVFVTYAGVKYHYIINNIYEVPKNGIVSLRRNFEKTSLTMITCTKDNDFAQTVYVAEQVG